jgi:[ribosomal protein S18]-alanine N-acetyltransferase
MPLILRRPHAADYAELATWIPDADTSHRWAGPQLKFPFSADELPGRLNGPGVTSVVLTDESDAPLGFGQFWVREAGSVHLGRIVVLSPVARGRGFGTALCRLLLDRAMNTCEVTTATLRVRRDNVSAMHSILGWASCQLKKDRTRKC